MLFYTVLSVVLAAPDLQEGDVVFQQSTSRQSQAITLATGSTWTHTGIVRIRDGRPWVLEAVQPVRLVTYDAWVARGVGENVAVFRPTTDLWTAEAIRRLDRLQTTWLGRDYDLRFEPGTHRLYCSELVREAYLHAADVELAPLRPVSSYTVDDPGLRQAMLQRWGRMPSDLMVVAPSDLASSKQLRPVTP